MKYITRMLDELTDPAEAVLIDGRNLSGWIAVFAYFSSIGTCQNIDDAKWPTVKLADLPSGTISVPITINGRDAFIIAGKFCHGENDWCIVQNGDKQRF